jgi:hypothetical protein
MTGQSKALSAITFYLLLFINLVGAITMNEFKAILPEVITILLAALILSALVAAALCESIFYLLLHYVDAVCAAIPVCF